MSRKIISWTFVFVLLVAFTSFVIAGRRLNTEAAYAAEIPHQFVDANDSVFVVVQDRLDVWQTIFARLRGLALQQSKLCQVSKSDFERLAKTRSLSVTTHMEDGISVAIATPDSPLSSNDIAVQVPNVHCQLLSIFEQLILQLTTQLS